MLIYATTHMGIGKGLKEYFNIFTETLIMESGSLPNHHLASMHFLMQIGQDVQKQEDPQRDIVCILG